jgi:hypothetical protein
LTFRLGTNARRCWKHPWKLEECPGILRPTVMLRVKQANDSQAIGDVFATRIITMLSKRQHNKVLPSNFYHLLTMQDSDNKSEAFTVALAYIGCNMVTAETIVDQGFTSPLTLLTVSEDSLSKMTRQDTTNNPRERVSFPFISVNLLKGVLYPMCIKVPSMH